MGKNPQALDTERLAVLDQTMNVDLVILKRCLQVIVYTKPSSRWADSETIASANNAVGSRARENSVAGEIQQIDVALSEVGHGTDADPIKSREVEAVTDADPIKSREVEADADSIKSSEVEAVADVDSIEGEVAFVTDKSSELRDAADGADLSPISEESRNLEDVV